MTEKHATTSGGLSARKDEPRAGESLARLSDHLGRLLAHADKLLAEWQAHADGLRGRFEKEGAASGEVLAGALRAALADAGQHATAEITRVLGANAEKLREDLERARQAAADLEAHTRRMAGGAKPTSVDEIRAGLAGIRHQLAALSPGQGRAPVILMLLSALSTLLAAAVLVVVLRRPAEAPPPAPAPVVEPAPIVEATPDAAAAPPPTVAVAEPCAALRVETPTNAPKLAAACAAELCGPPKPKLLAECKREDPAGANLVAALRSVERDRPFARLGCAPPKPDAEGRHSVTVRWLLDCAAR